jgi:hypothetical protein
LVLQWEWVCRECLPAWEDHHPLDHLGKEGGAGVLPV